MYYIFKLIYDSNFIIFLNKICWSLIEDLTFNKFYYFFK